MSPMTWALIATVAHFLESVGQRFARVGAWLVSIHWPRRYARRFSTALVLGWGLGTQAGTFAGHHGGIVAVVRRDPTPVTPGTANPVWTIPLRLPGWLRSGR
jgi:hypothetical protein